MIKRKRKGKKISAPKQEKEPAPVPDLMAALEKSLADLTGGKKQSRGGSGDGSRLEELSREELYERAQKAKVPKRSSMSKDQLVKALRE